MKTKSVKNPFIFLALAIFGVLYNRAVEWMEERSDADWMTSFQVAFGVAVTLLGASKIIGRRSSQWVLACFVASGTPMIVGHLLRWAKRQTLNGNL